MPPSQLPPAGGDIESRLQALTQRLTAERRNLEGAQTLVRAYQGSGNEQTIQWAQNALRESQTNVKFLEDQLAELSLRNGPGSSAYAQSQVQSRGHASSGSQGSTGGQPPYGGSSSVYGSYGGPSARVPVPTLNRDRPLPPPPPADDESGPKKETKNNTQLDVLRYDAPLTGAKITRMLNQLQFKLQVEEQYKTGIVKMEQAYRSEGDRRLRAETEAKRKESEGKIQLLRQAKKRYETLAKFGAVDDDDDLIPDAKRKDALRKPISGKLLISLRSARDLNYRPGPRKKGYGERFVVVRIEGTERAQSHASRIDKWLEDFEIVVEKANEVEITIMDSVAPNDSAPIGMFWFRVSDLLEALRRQKAEAGTGWATADQAASFGGRQGAAPESATLHPAVPGGAGGAAGAHGGAPTTGKSDGIEGWFSVEPAGAISLRLDFVKDTVAGGRRPYEALGRQGAVRKRKGDVHEMNGHRFVQRQFYQPLMCAFCSEFLLTGEGYQCEDCRYTCHKKCYVKVVTKCISKSIGEGEGDEEKINHRIPHRFTPFTNVGANWCCHCGYMLPFGRKNSVKCNECNVTCHQTCQHLVPDFCGMSMETANQLLKQLRDIKTGQVAKRPQPAVTAATPQAPQTPTQVQTQVQPPVSQQQQQPAAPYWQANQTVPQPDSLPPARYPEPRPAAPPTIPHSQSYNDSYGRTSSPSQQQQGAPRLSFESRPSFDTRPQDAAPAATGPLAPPPPRQQPARVPSPGASGYRPPVAAPVPMAGGRFQQQPVQAQPQQQQVYQPNAQQHYQPPAQQQVVRKRKIGLDDFNFLAVLGKGNFGKVMLAEERKSNNLYAIKVLKKEFIIENDEVESTQSEKRVFLAAAQERHPFLLGLHSCFQTETRVYFVMEYVSGGDLMLHIQRRQFTLRQAKFYACEVLLALQYFHSKDIIYRDLKLDNILLTLDGHVKVADYGLCKENMAHGKTTTTFCGTPEFMAPEILQEQPYSRAVDWWAFGVLTYEMLLGQSPFRGDDEDEIFDAILEDEPLYPLTMPKDAVSLLTELLTRDPKRRLGASVEDAEEIKRHAFFSDVNFDDVYHKRIPPPYFPTIGNATDTSNFDQEFTREQPTLTPVHTQLTAQDQQEFIGFSWVAPWAQ